MSVDVLGEHGKLFREIVFVDICGRFEKRRQMRLRSGEAVFVGVCD
jgi:hypothetical protein